MEHSLNPEKAVRRLTDDFDVDDYLAFLHISQRPCSDRWDFFRRDMGKVARLLRALPHATNERRLSRSIRRLQARMRIVVLYEHDPRECYAAFTEESELPRGGAYAA